MSPHQCCCCGHCHLMCLFRRGKKQNSGDVSDVFAAVDVDPDAEEERKEQDDENCLLEEKSTRSKVLSLMIVWGEKMKLKKMIDEETWLGTASRTIEVEVDLQPLLTFGLYPSISTLFSSLSVMLLLSLSLSNQQEGKDKTN